MWNSALPWWEFIARAAIVYGFLLFILRVTGKRQIGQLAPFDLVLLLVLSNALQNAMNGGDNSVIGGVFSAPTLFVIKRKMRRRPFINKNTQGKNKGPPPEGVHKSKKF